MISSTPIPYDGAVRSLLVVALSACTSTIAQAGDGKPMLRRGIDLYREASYAESVAMLEHARARGGMEPTERVECAFYLAAGYVALNSAGAARRELRTVLQEAPDYELPQYTSPKVAALFREVKDELEHAPRLRPLPPERHGDALSLRFEASRTGGRAFGVIEWRWQGDAAWREAALGHKGELLVADVPVERAGALEYYADGRAPQRASAGGLGGAAARAAGLGRAAAGADRRRAPSASRRASGCGGCGPASAPSVPPASASGSTSRCGRRRHRRPTPSSTSRCTDASRCSCWR